MVEISTTSGRIQYTTSGRIFHDQWSNTVHDQWSKFARPVVDFITTSGRICYDHWSTFLRPVVEYSTRLIWHVLGSRLPVTINRPVTTTGRKLRPLVDIYDQLSHLHDVSSGNFDEWSSGCYILQGSACSENGLTTSGRGVKGSEVSYGTDLSRPLVVRPLVAITVPNHTSCQHDHRSCYFYQ